MPKGQRPSIAPVDASAGSYAVLAGLLAFTARIGPHCPAVAINFHYGTILLTFRLKFSDSAISVRVSGVKLICCAQQIGLQIQVTCLCCEIIKCNTLTALEVGVAHVLAPAITMPPDSAKKP
jgi:hypothetical protein